MNLSDLIKYKSRGDLWTLGNDTLYRLCQDHPRHNTYQEITAKIWLIGRAYAAAIERRRNKNDENDNFYENIVVPEIKKSKIDIYLDILRGEKIISNNNIGQILKTHKYLTKVFADISGIEKRSLASKYLHFHLPNLFYIYDSRAVNSLKIILPKFRAKKLYKSVDTEYAKFFIRLNHLRDEIYKSEGQLLTPRELDNILLSVSS